MITPEAIEELSSVLRDMVSTLINTQLSIQAQIAVLQSVGRFFMRAASSNNITENVSMWYVSV